MVDDPVIESTAPRGVRLQRAIGVSMWAIEPTNILSALDTPCRKQQNPKP